MMVNIRKNKNDIRLVDQSGGSGEIEPGMISEANFVLLFLCWVYFSFEGKMSEFSVCCKLYTCKTRLCFDIINKKLATTLKIHQNVYHPLLI